MPSCINALKAGLVLLAILPAGLQAKEIGARIVYVDVLKSQHESLLNARFDYVLSSTAKQAINKGVPLAWVLRVKIQKPVWFWYRTIHELKIPYVIQYQALLNQYSVKNLRDGQVEMFAGLNAALRYMETVNDLVLPELTDEDDAYRLAIKVQFDREFLPIPLRPESYFDAQWALSSDWYLWPRQE